MKQLIAGMDEAGRGPVIGPLVIGLVACTPEELQQLKDIGVADSKALSGKRREYLKERITSICSIAKVLIVPAIEINLLMDQYTLNEIEILKFKQLLEPFANEIGKLYLDAADVNAERFARQFKDLVKDVVSEHKADGKYPIVAAASILAKTERDEKIAILQDKYRKQYPNLPSFGKGYPANARKFLEEYYQKYHEIPEIARTKWKTVKKIIGSQRKLDDFF